MKASALLFLVLLLPACTAKNAAYEKQLARLHETMTILEHERDRLEERIAVLEMDRQAHEQRAPVTGTLERPPLKVVQLAPPEDSAPSDTSPEVTTTAAAAAPAEAESQGQRTLLHGTGNELHYSEVEAE